jgi:hypothetical protein
MPDSCNFCGRAKRVCGKHPHGTVAIADGGEEVKNGDH